MYGSCWTCGGNHFSRECPKGDGGGVKGGGKNSGKAMKCYKCGGFGHRAAQCPTSVREIEYDEEEEGHGDVESVSWLGGGQAAAAMSSLLWVALGRVSDCGRRRVISTSA